MPVNLVGFAMKQRSGSSEWKEYSYRSPSLCDIQIDIDPVRECNELCFAQIGKKIANIFIKIVDRQHPFHLPANADRCHSQNGHANDDLQ